MVERLIRLQGAANVRDLGGYRNREGAAVRYKKAIRSAAISDLTAADAEQLAAYGIVKVVDFRSIAEQSREPDVKIPHTENIFLPIFKEDETQVSAAPRTLMEQIQAGQDAAQQMQKVYRHFIEEDYSRASYHRFIEILLENDAPEAGVLFHCTAGKDRTGFGAALILAILEVDQDSIMENYLETNSNMVQKTSDMLKQAQAAGAPEAMLAGIKELMRADQSYLAESFKAITKNYGDMSGFLKNGLQLSTSDLSDFRKLYTDFA